MRRTLAHPALHFLLLGGMLVAGERWLLRDDVTDDAPRGSIEIGRARVEALRAGWIARSGEAPDASVLWALIDAEIDDEVLLREARRRGLEAGDPVVRARLARNVGFIEGEDERTARAGEDRRVARALEIGLAQGDLVVRRRLIERMRAELLVGSPAAPSESEIAERFARERTSFAVPVRVRLSHVFLARERRGPALDADALRLREQIERDGLGIESAIARGDPFLLGHVLPLRSQAELARSFGDSFARRVLALEPGKVSPAIESAYGVHLVLVLERIDAAVPTFEAKRARIEAELLLEREAAALRVALDGLRARYQIRVEEVDS